VGNYNLRLTLTIAFSNLYSNALPNAYAGLSLNLPIFQGGQTLQNLSKAKLQVLRTDLDIVNSRNTINTEYVQALAQDIKAITLTGSSLKENVDAGNRCI
jgi:outer membrane protein